MSLHRTVGHAVAGSQRLTLSRQWLYSGAALRNFHVSRRNSAEENSKDVDQATPYNAPKRGPTRQQRAAMISEEVQMLQRDHPSPSFARADPDTLRPPGAGQTVDPEAVGENVGPGRMGENDTATREGPQAQGLGRVVAADDDVPDTSRQTRGVLEPSSVEEPSKGAAAVLDGQKDAQHNVPSVGSIVQPAETGYQQGATTTTGPAETQVAPVLTQDGLSDASRTQAISTLVNEFGPSTLAGNGAESTIELRINARTTMQTVDGERDIQDLARRLMDGHLVRFVSREEQAAVEVEAKNVAQQRLQYGNKWRTRVDRLRQPANKFTPLAATVRQKMVQDLVAGRTLDAELLTARKEPLTTPLLDGIHKVALQNGTYADRDRSRLVAKVDALLPASMAYFPRN